MEKWLVSISLFFTAIFNSCTSADKNTNIIENNSNVNLDSLLQSNLSNNLFLDFYYGMNKEVFETVAKNLVADGRLTIGHSLQLVGDIGHDGKVVYKNEKCYNYQLFYGEEGESAWLEVAPWFSNDSLTKIVLINEAVCVEKSERLLTLKEWSELNDDLGKMNDNELRKKWKHYYKVIDKQCGNIINSKLRKLYSKKYTNYDSPQGGKWIYFFGENKRITPEVFAYGGQEYYTAYRMEISYEIGGYDDFVKEINDTQKKEEQEKLLDSVKTLENKLKMQDKYNTTKDEI